jgi:hypothetical protein
LRGARTWDIDRRTRVDSELPERSVVSFLDDELPSLLATSSELLAGADRLDLRPLVVRIDGSSWRLSCPGGEPMVARVGGGADATARSGGDAWVEFTEAEFAALVDDQSTPIAMLTSGTLRLEGAGIGRLLDWWLVLRSVLDAEPLYVPGSVPVPDDLDRAFTLDDDPAEMAAFLAAAGFLVVRGVFSPAEMATVSADMDAAAPTYSRGDGNSWWARLADGSDALVRMHRFDEHSPTAAAMIGDDDRLDRLAKLSGRQHEHHGTGDNRIEALFKPIGVVEGISDIPWHKDCSLGRHSYECCRLTMGVSVTGAGPGTGQLRVIAGSHRALIWPALLDPTDLGLPNVGLVTETGDVTVHLSCTLHMAEPPTVASRRVLYTAFRMPGADDAAADAAREALIAARESAPLTVSQPSAVG